MTALLTLCPIVDRQDVSAQEPAERDEKASSKRDDEDDDLARRLIRETVEGQEDVMGKIIRLMSDSVRSLEVNLDAGKETQKVQSLVIENLDEAIKVAASQRRMSRKSPKNERGEKRRMSQNKSAGAKPPDPTNNATVQSGEAATVSAAGQVITPDASGGVMKETRRAWGNLPQRERDELLQGKEEAILESYRTWVEMYYKALQETE